MYCRRRSESTNSLDSLQKFGAKQNKMGHETKVYLFSDAVLIAGKRLGKPICRDFVLLEDLEVIDTSPNLSVFGLAFKKKVRKCSWITYSN